MSEPIKSFTADSLPVQVHATHEDLARAAAQTVREHLRHVTASQGSAAVIFASAASQVKFLAALVSFPDIEWPRIACFHMDEYLGITPQHSASFRRFLRERIEDRVKPKAFHYIQGESVEPLKEIQRYAGLLKTQQVDLCCLGIGENGHIAFNDPPVADFADPDTMKLVRLDLKCRQQQVGEGAFANLDAVPQYAFTLTIPALCAAQKMVCVVPEKRKAEAVRAALQGPVSTNCPASILRNIPHCTLHLDADSASLL